MRSFYLSENKMRHFSSFLPLFFSLFALCSDIYDRFRAATDLLDADQSSLYVSRETLEKHRDLSPRGASFYPMRYKRPFSDLPPPLLIEIPLVSQTQPLTPYICAFSRRPTPFHAFLMYFCLSSPVFKCFCFISCSWSIVSRETMRGGSCFCCVRSSRSTSRGS